MKIYDIETLKVEQKEILAEISRFVEKEAIDKDLYETELGIFRMMQRLGLLFLKENLVRRGTGKTEVPITVGEKTLPYHSTRECRYLSIFGEVVIGRAYYWKEGEKGCFPLDQVLNLPERRYSYLLCKWVQGSVVEEPYDKAIERFRGLLEIPISKLGQENVARRAGSCFKPFYSRKQPFDPDSEGRIIGVEADGKGVRMIPSEKPDAAKEKPARRAKGEKSGGLRKMAVATADFTFEPEPRTPEEFVEILMKERKPQLRQTFSQLGLIQRVDAIILDIMHAMEYLWDAGTALIGEKDPNRVPWVRKHALSLLYGRVGRVIGGLKQSISKRKLKKTRINTLKRVITYFENHRHMMRYDEYLAAGYPISTGLIEGTCGSLIKDRADRSGSRWSKKGVQAVLNERAVMKNGDWDAFWDFFMRSESRRLYADQYDQEAAA